MPPLGLPSRGSVLTSQGLSLSYPVTPRPPCLPGLPGTGAAPRRVGGGDPRDRLAAAFTRVKPQSSPSRALQILWKPLRGLSGSQLSPGAAMYLRAGQGRHLGSGLVEACRATPMFHCPPEWVGQPRRRVGGGPGGFRSNAGCYLGDGTRAAGACISVPVSERALPHPGPCVQRVFPPSGLLSTWGLWGVSQPLGGQHLRGPFTQHSLACCGTPHLQTPPLPRGATLQAEGQRLKVWVCTGFTTWGSGAGRRAGGGSQQGCPEGLSPPARTLSGTPRGLAGPAAAQEGQSGFLRGRGVGWPRGGPFKLSG